jgi:hypothetical protein
LIRKPSFLVYCSTVLVVLVGLAAVRLPWLLSVLGLER